jgi:hypothetical protein
MKWSSAEQFIHTFFGRGLWLLCPVVLLFVTTAAMGQQRPLITEDPRTIPMGSVFTEAGIAYLNRARFPVSGLEGNQFSLFVNGLHVGVGPRAEFQMGGVLHNFVKVRDGGSGSRNDWGDFWISTKLKLLEERGPLPVISFRPIVVLPNTNNDKGLGTDGTHFFGTILTGKTVGPAFLFGNIGLGILDDAVRAAAQQDVLTYGVAAVLPLTSRLNLAGEWNGRRNPQDNPTPGGEDRGEVRLGAQIRAAGIRWDLGVVAGLTRLDPRAGVVFGMTKEFQLWK